jgi:biotin---protein ligase
MAWKVDTGLAMLIETDIKKFSQLILNTFLQNNYSINDGFKVLRIETVKVEGKPQEFDDILSHSRWSVNDVQAPEDWEKRIEGIRNLGRLANQASEFEYKKNLTEGKTGIVQPDLISSKNIEESLLHVVTSPDTPKKKMLVLEKTGEKILGLKVERERQELLKSPLNPTASFPDFKDPKATTPESPKFPTMSPAKSPTPSIKSKISNEPLSPKFPTGSPVKKPTFITNDKPSIVMMEPKVVKFEEKVEAKVEPKIAKVEPKVEPKVSKVEPLIEVKVEPSMETNDAKKPQPTLKESTSNFLEAEKKQEIPVEPKKTIIEPTKSKPLNLPPISTPEPQQVSQEAPKLPSSKSPMSIRRKKQKLMAAKPPNILVYSDSITTRDNVIKTLGSILQKNTYTIYPLTGQQAQGRIWLDNTSLLVVCGSVNGSDLGTIFLDFFFKGGKVLCLCSDLLRHVLPTYHTAEVRRKTFQNLQN